MSSNTLKNGKDGQALAMISFGDLAIDKMFFKLKLAVKFGLDIARMNRHGLNVFALEQLKNS